MLPSQTSGRPCGWPHWNSAALPWPLWMGPECPAGRHTGAGQGSASLLSGPKGWWSPLLSALPPQEASLCAPHLCLHPRPPPCPRPPGQSQAPTDGQIWEGLSSPQPAPPRGPGSGALDSWGVAFWSAGLGEENGSQTVFFLVYQFSPAKSGGERVRCPLSLASCGWVWFLLLAE